MCKLQRDSPVSDHAENSHEHIDEGKRDFIYIAAGAAAAVGAASIGYMAVDQMNMAADTRASGSIEIDLENVIEGQQIKALWRGKPVFVRHRTPEEIAEAEAVDIALLPDPQTDNERLIANKEGKLDPRFLVMVGVCTHFGCVPIGEQGKVDARGEYGGWYCPCHGSHYDTAGRIRKGPAPKNLEVPTYEYISDTVIKVG